MPAKAKAQDKGLRGTQGQAKTRLLLALWDIKGAEAEVRRKDLTDRVILNNERVGDYKGVFEELKEEGAITIGAKKRVEPIFLTDKGLQMLDAGIKSPDFEFEGKQVRSKDVAALLKWFRERERLTEETLTSAAKGKTPEAAITSYETFKSAVLEVYDQLNREHHLDELVEIYRIRRAIGKRLTRTQFDEWMLEMQANEILQLQGGSLPNSSQKEIEDSIKTELSGLRCYAKRLKP